MITVRRRSIALAVLLVTALTAAGYARWIEPYRVVVDHIDVPVRNAPDAFADLRVAYIADLHVDGFTRLEANYVDRLRNLDLDLLLIGGDFITSRYYQHEVVANAARACSVLATIPVRYGKYAVWGNNDYPSTMTEVIEGCGITVLENEWTAVELPGGTLTLVGLDDPVTGRVDWDAALSPPPPDPHVFLVHSPDGFAEARRRAASPLLVGHTHGGQVRHPFIRWFPTRFLRLLPGTPAYVAGAYIEDNCYMYVTRGLGTSYVRLRFLCPPEIAMVRFVRA